MSRGLHLAVLSDIHYASPAEQARGDDYEYRELRPPWLRAFVRAYRRHVWLRDPLRHNHLLDRFLARVGEVDHVVANGDYTCDSAFVGVMDEPSFQSAAECLGRLRARFDGRFHATLGDHDLGKFSFVGTRGGMRLASFQRARTELGLAPFWQFDLGRYAVLGVTSSLVGLPVLQKETLPEEREQWNRLREAHLAEIRAAFGNLDPARRVVLFCHDPTALPFLASEAEVASRLDRVDLTIIGHLHSRLVYWESRLLAGMPAIRGLGHTVRRLSTALNQARAWRPFHVRLCPSLAGVELLKDGGYLTVRLDPDAAARPEVQFHRLPR
ncbi:MAG: metallophosphoesterase [Verrucomicrobiota bacterium]